MTKINVLPLEFFPKRILNSLCKVLIIMTQNICGREGVSQNIGGIIVNPRKILNQFMDRLKFVEGSKEEKRFAIIFRSILVYFFVYFFLRDR